jgi:hypothetical protein
MKKKYRPIPQLPFCCVPATIQWILYRRSFDIQVQEEIGRQLGLKIPKKFSKYFPVDITRLPNDSKKFGTQIDKKKYSVNNFFRENKIPLRMSPLLRFSDISRFEIFLLKNLGKDVDLAARINNSLLTNGKGVGHFCLIVDFDPKNKIVSLGDPEPPFFKKVSISDLLLMMSKKFDGIERGLHIIKLTSD